MNIVTIRSAPAGFCLVWAQGADTMNQIIFRIATGLLFFSALAMSTYFRRKANVDSGETVSRKDEGKPIFLILRLGGLTLWLMILAYVIDPAWMSWSKAGLPLSQRLLGIAIGSLCFFLLFWIFRSIGSGITDTVSTRTEHKLVKSGPYRFIRHPLYSFGTGLFLSFALMADNWFLAVIALFALIVLSIRLPNEEAHLVEKFGDEYREYQ